MKNIVQLTSENFQQVLGASDDVLIALQFWSQSSPESIEQQQHLHSIATEYPEHFILATLDCDQQRTLASQLAQQVGLQALPTVLLLKNGAPLDMLPGAIEQQALVTAITSHLPAQAELIKQDIQTALVEERYNDAFMLSKKGYELALNDQQILAFYIHSAIKLGKIDLARELLAQLPSDDENLVALNAELESAISAQESPEIKALEEKLAITPDNLTLQNELAVLYHQAGQHQKALESLFFILSKDLSFQECRKQYLEWIAELPSGDEIAQKYRRKLYSILY